MNTYVVLLNYTEEGARTVKDSPARAAAVAERIEEAGGRIKDYYLTMGAYDFVVIFEMPDDETMARMLLEVGRLGAVRTQTMRAFTQDQFKSIVGALD